MCPEVKGANFADWSIISRGINCVVHEPITCSIRIDIFCMKYAGVQVGMSILG